MQIFINELSLHEQYYTETEFTQAVKEFIGIFSKFQQHKITSYKDAEVFITRNAIKGQAFQTSLEKIKDKGLKDAFRLFVFAKNNPKDWRIEQQHNSHDDLFYCNILKDIVTGTTLAEVAERNLKAEKENVVVNFANSAYQDCKEIDIFKNDEKCENPIKIPCIEQAKDFENFVKKQDNSTIYHDYLENSGLFDRTNLCYTGTSVRIFRKKSDNSYWYFD